MNILNELSSSVVFGSWPVTILLVSVLLLCVVSLVLMKMTRKLTKEYNQVKIIKEDLKAFSVAAIGVGKRVIQLERRQQQALKQPVETEKIVTYVEPSNQTYDEAAHMARQGKNIESIMHRCGLSHSEAELIFLMNKLDKVS